MQTKRGGKKNKTIILIKNKNEWEMEIPHKMKVMKLIKKKKKKEFHL